MSKLNLPTIGLTFSKISFRSNCVSTKVDDRKIVYEVGRTRARQVKSPRMIRSLTENQRLRGLRGWWPGRRVLTVVRYITESSTLISVKYITTFKIHRSGHHILNFQNLYEKSDSKFSRYFSNPIAIFCTRQVLQ